MQNFGMAEVLIILGIALLVFGAKRLPEMGASLGRGIREFKRGLSEAADAIREDDSSKDIAPRSSSAPSSSADSSGEPKRLSG